VTVRVRSITCEGIGTGSGFLVGDRYLISNRHVVKGAYGLEVTTWDGQNLEVEVAGYSTIADIGVIELSHPIPQGDWSRAARSIADLTPNDPSPGERVYAAGYPGGRLFELTDGEVVDFAPGFAGARRAIRFTSHVEPGNSGGPLLDDSGNVVGVVYAKEVRTGLGLAVPISEVISQLKYGQPRLVDGC